MKLTNIFNICIAVAVYSNNVTFGGNVSAVFEMSAIHTVSFQPSFELLVSTPCVYRHKVLLQLRSCRLRYAFAILLIYH